MFLDVYNTHMELYPYTKDAYPVIEDMFTAIDKFTGKTFPCGYIIEDGKLYLPRGTQVSKIESICGVTANYINESDSSEKMSQTHYAAYDPRDKLQEDSIKFLTTEGGHQLGLNLKTGLGKAQPLSTRIPTPYGYTTMGELKVGDVIFNSKGRWTRVTDIYYRGVRDVYQITFSDGRTAKCCKDHLWKVIDEDGRENVLPLREIMKDYKYYSFEKDDGIHDPHLYKYKIPRLNFPTLMNEIPDISDSYIISAAIYFASKMYNFRNTKNLTDQEIIDIERNRILSEQDGSGIWKEILTCDFESRLLFLKTIIEETSRVINVDGVYMTTLYIGNQEIFNDIRDLVLGLGCSVGTRPGIITIHMSPIIADQGWALSTKPDVLQQFQYLTIKDICCIGVEECQCITVDAEDKLYLTEDYIVTHNTFCVAYSSTQLNEKTIIITPNDDLKRQWIKTYRTMFGYRDKHLMNITGSVIMDMIMADMIDPADVYFVNHQTLRSYMTNTNGYNLHRFFKKTKCGIKVYDEAHMEFGNILLIDFFSNTNRTWYLTATFDRSDKTESVCFKRAFNSVVTFGEVQSSEVVEKHVLYHIVNINSHPSPKDRGILNGYQGFTATGYGNYAFLRDPNETAYRTILTILEKMKDVEGKTMIFVPLIDAVDRVVSKLKKDFPYKSVAAFHSRVSKSEKEDAEKKDIIVSTIKSCGTGKDIKGLRCVICCEPVASRVVIEQTIGRLRPYVNSKGEDKETYYFDVCDIGIQQINWWFKARYKKIQNLVKETVHLNLDK